MFKEDHRMGSDRPKDGRHVLEFFYFGVPTGIRLPVKVLFALCLQPGLRRRPQAGSRRLPAFDSLWKVRNALRFGVK